MTADDETSMKRGVISGRKKMRKKHPPEPMGTGRKGERRVDGGGEGERIADI